MIDPILLAQIEANDPILTSQTEELLKGIKIELANYSENSKKVDKPSIEVLTSPKNHSFFSAKIEPSTEKKPLEFACESMGNNQ